MKRLLVLCLVLVALLGPAAPVSASRAPALDWVVSASGRLPISEAEQREHLSESFLSAIGGKFNSTMTSVGRLSRPRVLSSTSSSIEAVSASWLVSLSVDDAGLIDGLRFRPYLPSPTTWSELDSRLRTLAPTVSFATYSPADGCRQVHAVDGDAVRPLGSAFKLYVLGALARAVAGGDASWDQRLPIRERWKSLPSGTLQDEPAGTRLPLRQYADLMISISDNTAADHLIHFLGRPALRDQLARFGNHAPGNDPFLTTRELFALKGYRYPALANTFLSLPPARRASLLPAVDAVPRSRIQPWVTPRAPAIEWFGAPRDMCEAFAGLLATKDPAVDHALSISDGGIGLDRSEFPEVWFKGGSEPGVLTLNYLAREANGRVRVSSLMLANPRGPLAESTPAEALALIRGGLELA